MNDRHSDPDSTPEVFALVRRDGELALDRRHFFGGLAAGSALGVAACTPPPPTPAPPPPARPAVKAAPPVPDAPRPQRVVEGSACARLGLRAHRSPVRKLLFDAASMQLVSVDGAGVVKLWDLARRRLVRKLESSDAKVAQAAAMLTGPEVHLVAPRPDGGLAGWRLPSGLAIDPSARRPVLDRWDPRTAPMLAKALAERTGSAVRAVAASADGRWLAIGRQDQLQLLRLDGQRVETAWEERSDPVASLAFAPDGSWLAAGQLNGQVFAKSVADGRVLMRANLGSQQVSSLAASPDGARLAGWSAESRIVWWSTQSWQLLPRPYAAGVGEVRSLAFSADGRQLAAGGGNGVTRVFQVDQPESFIHLSAASSAIDAMAFSANGRLLATADADGALLLWPLPLGTGSQCLYDDAEVDTGTAINQARVMGPGLFTQPCGTPLPPGATCVCNCVGGHHLLPHSEPVCICDTVSIGAGAPLPAGAYCVCNTISVGSRAKPVPSGHERRMNGTVCTCNTICTCNTVSVPSTSHYWRPN